MLAFFTSRFSIRILLIAGLIVLCALASVNL
jgi:hypothetical protein